MLQLQFPTGQIHGTIHLPVSKSLVNRQLILAAQAGQFPAMADSSLPEDVRRLAHLLAHPGPVWDAGAGGTTLRFLTAYLALSGKDGIVTGSARMQVRPIAPLMHALEQLGALYAYSGITGCPPILLNGFRGQTQKEISLDPSSSSQFLTAILLASPLLQEGLTIHLTQPITSRPYFDMTLAVLRHWGIQVDVIGDRIIVEPQPILPRKLVLEADWTAASYAYALLALAPSGSSIELPGLCRSGLQGDEILAEWMTAFGIDTMEGVNGTTLRRSHEVTPDGIELDFSDSPDLAQTLIVLCAILGCPGRFSGLHTLQIKETDRTAALQSELGKTGVQFEPESEGSATWLLTGKVTLADTPTFATYHDHRMAMALSLCAFAGICRIEDPQVIEKSFPNYWKELEGIGWKIDRI